MNDSSDKPKIEIIDDKSILSNEEKLNDVNQRNNNIFKFKITNKNLLYIIIIIICFVILGFFLLFYNKNNKDISKYVIEDRTGSFCQQSLNFFYEDETYKYYFNCKKEYYVILNNEEYTLEEALKEGIINIKDLGENNIRYYKETIVK